MIHVEKVGTCLILLSVGFNAIGLLLSLSLLSTFVSESLLAKTQRNEAGTEQNSHRVVVELKEEEIRKIPRIYFGVMRI